VAAITVENISNLFSTALNAGNLTNKHHFFGSRYWL
jgi:hypothetical protein